MSMSEFQRLAAKIDQHMQTEPCRDFRRLFSLSHATSADSRHC